ncbi:MAG TPA: holdfast anchoring protein HfaA [Rhizomicrobium sp.]|nr:holdfast anchoring protein HfaA [Rhizomicrobium sp.]
MPHTKKILALVLPAALAVALTIALAATRAHAQSWNSVSNYNGYGATTQNNPSNASLRDPNGNLTLVDGQFRSSNFSSQAGTQFAGAGGTGVGVSGAGAAQYGQASAIGNSLNVVVLGSHNTTVVDTTQINNGNQTAIVDLNSH